MSELRKLVEAIRGLSDYDLRTLITSRLVSIGNIEDFYSLAETLNSVKSYAAVIGSLSRKQLDNLKKVSEAEVISAADYKNLLSLQLVYEDSGKIHLFEPLREALKSAKAFTRQLTRSESQSLQSSVSDIDGNCGLVAFETMQALTELIFDLEKHLIKAIGKGSVGLADVKRLAVALGKPNDYAKKTFALASSLGLTAISQGRHLLTKDAVAWLKASDTERMHTLHTNFLGLLGDDLAAELSNIEPGQSLREWLEDNFPLAENTEGSRISQILQRAGWFGLTFSDRTSSWFSSVLKVAKNAEELLKQHLPKVQARIILQADLSIIAPGPLPTELEAQLRLFANTASVGLASTYRLSPLSICHGLETGLSANEIASILEKSFGQKLPQPVEYLLGDVSKRFDRLVIRELANSENRSILESTDNVLLTELSNDPRLRAFSLVRLSNERLACRFEPSVVYFGLRECGYLAIRKDEAGRVISPIASTQTIQMENTLNKWDERIAKMRESDATHGLSGSDEVMTRQVQLAIRNKAKLSLVVKRSDGSEMAIILEPSGLANGRLRGLDRKAQVERTLPLSTIASITLA